MQTQATTVPWFHRGVRTAALVCAAVLAAAALTGCQTAYYSAMEQFGVQKRHILRDRVEAGRDEQRDAQEQFQTTYEAFQSVTGYRGGDLEKVYKKLQSEYDDSEAQAQAVRDRIESIRRVAADLFSEWKTEIGQISSKELRRSSEASLRDTQSRYDRMIKAMERAEARMDPVLVVFRDQVLFLKHNLNARAIASLEGTVISIESDVEALISDMSSAIEEANAFVATLDG